MNAAKTIREALNISQYDFAAYLSVSRALLAKNETGQRSLPTVALLKLAAIAKLMESDNSTGADAEIQKQSAQTKKMLFARAQKYSRLATIATIRLETMRNRYLQCVKLLQVSTDLLTNLPSGKESKDDRLCLEIMQRDAIKKMRNCGLGQQAVLQLQADGFTYQAKQAEKMMG